MGAGERERAVASSDEESGSMAVEAARDAVRGGVAVDTVLFATTSPAYAEKLDAATIQAALDLPESVGSVGLGGSSRMGLAALLLGLDLAAAGRRALVCASDVIVGAPGGARESQGGDGAAAFVTGSDRDAIARVLGRASATIEIVDGWRVPEERVPRQWEERFIADTMAPAIADTARRALEAAGVEPSTLATVILDGTNPRSMAGLPKALGLRPEQVADPLAASVGRTGVAHAGLLLARALDQAKRGDRRRDERFADTSCRVATYTLDHLAYSLQPPVVAAFVDYEGGGRFSSELTDVDPKDVAIGNHLEMTFRRLFTAQGVHNYFWKARPGR